MTTSRPVAVVSGSSSGIGAAIAARLLEDGWAVTGLDRAPPTLTAAHFTSLSVDLADGEALAKCLGPIAEPGALVHAAGFMRVAPLGTLDAAEGAAMWRIHVDAACRLADLLAPRMTSGGRIVVVGSRTAAGAAGRSQYAASKAALTGLARSWAIELAPRGITVNVIAPGATDTPMLRDPARGSVAPRLPPIGRFVRPQEVAALAAFLLGPEAGAITGQQILVCGGASL
ncbi:MAG: SDR family oxidoreductase [Rhodospirillales bacterium]|nr:SDR family oxidoreductase [Rhodospirillales bacterium]